VEFKAACDERIRQRRQAGARPSVNPVVLRSFGRSDPISDKFVSGGGHRDHNLPWPLAPQHGSADRVGDEVRVRACSQSSRSLRTRSGKALTGAGRRTARWPEGFLFANRFGGAWGLITRAMTRCTAMTPGRESGLLGELSLQQWPEEGAKNEDDRGAVPGKA
jgi:hypothetical protein